jgi:hypothetical protein
MLKNTVSYRLVYLPQSRAACVGDKATVKFSTLANRCELSFILQTAAHEEATRRELASCCVMFWSQFHGFNLKNWSMEN